MRSIPGISPSWPCLLAEYAREEVDLMKVVKMLLYHDVVEIDAGDTFAYDEAAHADKAERERAGR